MPIRIFDRLDGALSSQQLRFLVQLHVGLHAMKFVVALGLEGSRCRKPVCESRPGAVPVYVMFCRPTNVMRVCLCVCVCVCVYVCVCCAKSPE